MEPSNGAENAADTPYKIQKMNEKDEKMDEKKVSILKI